MSKPTFSLALMTISFPSITAGSVQAETIPYTDYGSGTTVELALGKGIWQMNWGQGPWTWFDAVGTPLLDTNVSGVLDIHATAAADISTDLKATMPITGTLTLTATDADDHSVVTGVMALSGSGINVIDISAGRVIVDEAAGMFLAPFNPPDPSMSLVLDSATGSFAGIEQAGNWDLLLAGFYAAPLIEGMALQDNINYVLGGGAPVIGGTAEFVLTGQYVPEPATLVLLGLGGLALLRRHKK